MNFSTIYAGVLMVKIIWYKMQNSLHFQDELFLLVTDQGFLTESNVVWETLSNVEGDGEFVDASFCPYHKSDPSTQLPSGVVEVTDQMINQE